MQAPKRHNYKAQYPFQQINHHIFPGHCSTLSAALNGLTVSCPLNSNGLLSPSFPSSRNLVLDSLLPLLGRLPLLLLPLSCLTPSSAPSPSSFPERGSSFAASSRKLALRDRGTGPSDCTALIGTDAGTGTVLALEVEIPRPINERISMVSRFGAGMGIAMMGT
ncbi:hypothetical protein V491_03342, partial [Pseudogymnoascus sp. VKM F-3775]